MEVKIEENIGMIVSACLIMSDYTGAAVSELFTHSLYRARGLATTEVTACANSFA